MRLRILSLPRLLGLFLLSGCAASASGIERQPDRQPGFGALRLDANPEKTFVSIFDDKGQQFAGAARLSKKAVSNSAGGSRALPRSIRATWRSGQPYLTSEGTWTGGTVMGDYTAAVAERIPQEVFDYIRQHGGALRLKLRIVDGAVLVGWDVEQFVPAQGRGPGGGDGGVQYAMAGGDFHEDRVVNGKVVEPGWERIPPAPAQAARKQQP